MFDRFKARLLLAPTLGWNLLLAKVCKVRRWWDEVDPGVVLGALPFRSDVPKLAAMGVTAVVNTCEEWPGPIAAYDKFGIRQLRIPTVDFTHPNLADVENAVEFIEKQLGQGGKVYVHCKAGRARSATVVACWLIAARGLSRGEAQALLSEKRPHVNPRIANRPVVIDFEKRWRNKPKPERPSTQPKQ